MSCQALVLHALSRWLHTLSRSTPFRHTAAPDFCNRLKYTYETMQSRLEGLRNTRVTRTKKSGKLQTETNGTWFFR